SCKSRTFSKDVLRSAGNYHEGTGTGGSATPDSDRGLTRIAVLTHLLCDTHGLFDAGLHDLRLADGLDDHALVEDLTLAGTGGHTEDCAPGLSRAVNHTTHDGHAQRHVHALESCGDLVGALVDIDLGTATAVAGDDFQAALPKPQGLQDLGADLDLLRGR